MLKVGITGGIGSGKSTVAAIFEILGVPVFYADNAAKQMMNTDPNIIEGIQSLFGESSYINGVYNREYVASVVFKDTEKLKALNELVHPITIAAAEEWMQSQNTPYCLKEAALIFESHAEKKLDLIIGVYASPGVRIKRIVQRDQLNEDQVIARMSKQMNEDDKMRLCDYVILNDESQLLIPQLVALHEILLEKSKMH
jgi:dephospho-CoA kinase